MDASSLCCVGVLFADKSWMMTTGWEFQLLLAAFRTIFGDEIQKMYLWAERRCLYYQIQCRKLFGTIEYSYQFEISNSCLPFLLSQLITLLPKHTYKAYNAKMYMNSEVNFSYLSLEASNHGFSFEERVNSSFDTLCSLELGVITASKLHAITNVRYASSRYLVWHFMAVCMG